MANHRKPNFNRAVCLVAVEEAGAFEARKRAAGDDGHDMLPKMWVTEEGLAVLKSFPRGPHVRLRVVGVTGKARKGKSTICAALVRRFRRQVQDLRKEHMFDTGHGRRTVTSGVWIWGEAIPIPREEGGGFLVIIDTEGTERGNDTTTAQLTAISCFLSGNLMLHVDGGVSNADLRGLMRLVVTMKQSGMAGDTTRAMYPRLTICSRSMTPEWLEEEGIGPESDLSDPRVQARIDGVLESELKEGENDGYDETRARLKRVFPRRSYMVSLTASKGDRGLLKVEDGAKGELALPRLAEKSPFAVSYRACLERLVKQTEPLRFGSVHLDGEQIAEVLPRFVEGVQANVIDMPSVLFTLHKRIVDDVVDRLAREYTTAMERAPHTTVADVQRTHEAEAKTAHAKLAAEMKERELDRGVARRAPNLLDARMKATKAGVTADAQKRAKAAEDARLKRERDAEAARARARAAAAAERRRQEAAAQQAVKQEAERKRKADETAANIRRQVVTARSSSNDDCVIL